MSNKPFTADKFLRDFYVAASEAGTLENLETIIAGYAKTMEDWRASALSPLPIVNGAECVACGHPTLFLGEGGYITCSLDGCPDPGATQEALEKLDVHPKTTPST